MRFQAKSAAVLGTYQSSITFQERARSAATRKYLQVEAIGKFSVRALTQKKPNRLNMLYVNSTLCRSVNRRGVVMADTHMEYGVAEGIRNVIGRGKTSFKH